jgi:hypothetical protein
MAFFGFKDKRPDSGWKDGAINAINAALKNSENPSTL